MWSSVRRDLAFHPGIWQYVTAGLLLALGWCIPGSSVPAQELGQITGRVLDPNGQPRPGASLVPKGTARGGAAGNDGRYVITVPPGTYTLRASFLSCRSETVSVTLAPGTTVTRNFALPAKVTNLSGSRGLTEGSPRIEESFSEEEAFSIDVFIGRPVPPRALELSLSYDF